MNRSELMTAVANNTGLTKKDTELAVSAALELIAQTLAEGDKVQIAGFGSFEVKQREERLGRNPSNGEVIVIAASRQPVFKAGKALKDRVNR